MRITEPSEDLKRASQQENAGPRRDQQALRLVQAPLSEKADIAGSRLAVILVADVADYTRHMARDEAGTHARCTAVYRNLIQPGIAGHGARIIKHTGDGFMAEFWSATRAVWFAVDFQGAVRAWNARRIRDRRLEFRVGINLGDVIVEPHDVFGHNVNIAARLEAIAEPGAVLVSYAVFASVRDPRLLFEDAGDLPLKNMNETVRGFRARARPTMRSGRPSAKGEIDSAARSSWSNAVVSRQ
jgi:adenylate cyclase